MERKAFGGVTLDGRGPLDEESCRGCKHLSKSRGRETTKRDRTETLGMFLNAMFLL